MSVLTPRIFCFVTFLSPINSIGTTRSNTPNPTFFLLDICPSRSNMQTFFGNILEPIVLDSQAERFGSSIDIYRIIRLSTDTIDTIVAIKVFRSKPGDMEASARLNAALSKWSRYADVGTADLHPLVCFPSIVDAERVGWPAPVKALAMPWFAKGNVLEYIETNPDVDRLILVLQLAEGLEHLHSRRFIHGGIHPGNVLISDQGCAVITDIGVGTFLGQLIKSSGWGILYQPKEQLLPGDQVIFKPNEATDVYTFASTAYAILSGRRIFSKYSILKGLAEIFENGHTRLQIPNGVDSAVWSVLQHCWQGDSQRPRMSGVVADLRHASATLKAIRDSSKFQVGRSQVDAKA